MFCITEILFLFNFVCSGNCSKELSEFSETIDNVNLIGYVESLDNYYLSTDIVVIPILSGSGTRLKALEAMKFQKAIVSTTKGVEGINIIDQIKIENDPFRMATVITSLLENDSERNELGKKAKLLVEKSFDWNVIGSKIKKSILA